MTPTVSIVINTKNAEKTLQRTLQSVSNFDSLVVVDMESTDKTVAIAKKHTKNVYSFKDVGYVEPARNYAISQSPTEWVLLVDADEEVSPELAKKVKELVVATTDTVCYFIPRKNIIFGKWIQKTGWWPDFQPRLFKKTAVTWNDEVHSVPKIDGPSEYLPVDPDQALIHHNYESVSDFLQRLDKYTTVASQDLSDGSEVTAPELVRSFTNELSRRLFKEKGIEEGIHGTGLSYLQSMYELIVSLKAWEISDHKDLRTDAQETIEAVQEMQHSLAYWIADYKVEHSSGLEKLIWKVRRKLQL